MKAKKIFFTTLLFSCISFSLILFFNPTAYATPPVLVPPGLPGCCYDLDRILRPTSPSLEGPDIMELQMRLKELNYFKGEINGIYDENTITWVKKFQKDNNIAPTGWVTVGTWKALAQDVKVPVSSSQDSPRGNIELVIYRDKQTLVVYVNGKEFKRYPVAVGKYKTPTPIGEFKIVSKGTGWGGGFGTRWMGLNVPWGIYGIHGTNKPWSIGRYASHGCIRMHNKNVEELFRWVPLGTPVTIVGTPPKLTYKPLQVGSSSPDVIKVQSRLRELGLYLGPTDGRFGKMTEISLMYFQAVNGLEPDGKVGKETYKALGL
ncbi:MAG: hypothetical protein PWQ96_989 [Clostridia bacterium]|jgi:peptidoglycan hydrolase-like protein with peptidoglycan-binding domain|nr:ErfK/YbiS/YcfS/YnhG family protein [Clostridiales bacterium]MDK2985347.1 hypothetical protein [Clostridia bacterium]